MKRTTAIILILAVMVVALGGALIYEVSKDDWNIIVSPNEEKNPSGQNPIKDKEISGDSGNKLTQVEPDSIIIQDEVVENPTNDDIEVKDEYDLIVFGAEPEGIAAAIMAARSQMEVLLVENRDGPGGLMTYGMLNTIDMNLGPDGELLNGGVFEEFYTKLGRTSFDVAEAKQIFQNMLDEEKEYLTQMYDVENIEVSISTESNDFEDKNGDSIEENHTLQKEIRYVMIDGDKYVAQNYIDCTQDAEITAKAGAEYTIRSMELGLLANLLNNMFHHKHICD